VLNQSDWKDMLLMILGSIGSLADGSAMALMMLIVSSLMNSYGDASFTLQDVNKVGLKLH
jgi:ATP-binding cassette subfamily B (MDR/TAP) protein 1